MCQEARRLPVAPQMREQLPQPHPPRRMRRSLGMPQNPCSKRSPRRGEICHHHWMERTPTALRRTMDHPPRTLMATTGTAVSITKTAEDGRRMHRGIRREVCGGEDPEEPPGGRGGAGRGDGGAPPPPPGGDGDQPRNQPRQAGIIDGDVQGAAIIEVLSGLAKRFEKPSRLPPPPIPTFKDSYKEFPFFKAD